MSFYSMNLMDNFMTNHSENFTTFSKFYLKSKILKRMLGQFQIKYFMLEYSHIIIISFSLAISACVSTPDDLASNNPAKNVCPKLGNLKIEEIIPQTSIIYGEEIAVRTLEEGIKIFPIKYFVNALQIDDQQELKSYYSIYQRVCGKELLPPFENEIAFNKNLKSTDLRIIDDDRKANEKMFGKIPFSQVLDLTDNQKLVDFELFHFHQFNNPGIYYAFTQGGLDGNEFEIRNRMNTVKYIGNFH